MCALPLRLPPSPFDLEHARAAASLVREAYRATKAWEEADKPAPEAYAWELDAQLGNYDEASLIWTEAEGLFKRARPVALIARQGPLAFLAFRGTETPADLWTNMQVRQAAYDIPNCAEFGRVHEGFLQHYRALRANLEAQLFHGLLARAPIETLVVAGHSMGAAVSTLAIPDLARNVLELPRQTLTHYTFGCPRVGSSTFARAFDGLASAHELHNVMSYRVVNTADLTVQVPPAALRRGLGNEPEYQHVGTVISLSHNYGDPGANHHHSRVYMYALEHPQAPVNPGRSAKTPSEPA